MTMNEGYIALLRAVNVAGHQMVAMADLRDMLAALGYTDVKSLLQSGNLVFRGKPQESEKVEHLLQKSAAERLDLQTEFFVRTAAEWKAIVAANPFPAEAKKDPGHLVVMALKRAPERARFAELQQSIAGREVVRGHGREAYITYPDGQGRSRLTNALIEKKLGTRGTARNWNTVMKLLAACG